MKGRKLFKGPENGFVLKREFYMNGIWVTSVTAVKLNGMKISSNILSVFGNDHRIKYFVKFFVCRLRHCISTERCHFARRLTHILESVDEKVKPPLVTKDTQHVEQKIGNQAAALHIVHHLFSCPSGTCFERSWSRWLLELDPDDMPSKRGLCILYAVAGEFG